MARANAPPLKTPDVDAWERSLDVNVRGFVYSLAAVLPAMRERGGGRVVVVNVAYPGDAPDPLLRAWRAAVRTILEELPGELPGYGIRAAKVGLDAQQARNPEGCAETIVRALKDPESAGRRTG